jgi:methanogenic corrinoid protein MtbC1
VAALVSALLGGDEDTVHALVAQTPGVGGSRADVFADLFQPAQVEIGELWYRGDIGVDDEHRATAIVARMVDSLRPTPNPRPVPPGSVCVLATLAMEQHVLGLRVLSMALEDDGWTVERLPPMADTDLVEAVRGRRPRVVGVSAAFLPSAEALRTAIEMLRLDRVPVLVGGSAFNRSPGLWRKVGADGHGTDARVAVGLARKLAGA